MKSIKLENLLEGTELYKVLHSKTVKSLPHRSIVLYKHMFLEIIETELVPESYNNCLRTLTKHDIKEILINKHPS